MPLKGHLDIKLTWIKILHQLSPSPNSNPLIFFATCIFGSFFLENRQDWRAASTNFSITFMSTFQNPIRIFCVAPILVLDSQFPLFPNISRAFDGFLFLQRHVCYNESNEIIAELFAVRSWFLCVVQIYSGNAQRRISAAILLVIANKFCLRASWSELKCLRTTTREARWNENWK